MLSRPCIPPRCRITKSRRFATHEFSVRRSLFVAAIVGIFAVAPAAAANLYSYEEAIPLKAPDCVTDLSTAFFEENIQAAEPPHPGLPVTNFYLIVRYMGGDAISARSLYDFGHIDDMYPYPPYRGLPLTGLTVPEPKAQWQRAKRFDATPDNSSAFQMHCYDAASFINTWNFAAQTISGGGPHAIYGYSFNDPPPPAIYDGYPSTDFVLQASIEIPWFAAYTGLPGGELATPIGQVSLFAYLRDRVTQKTFALLLGVFDNRSGAETSYPSTVAHDGATPFVSVPFSETAAFATLSPYSSKYTGIPWTGLRFFRAHVTQANFAAALNAINAYCRSHPLARYCETDFSLGTAYSASVTNYELTDFGVLHEVDRGGADGNLSMGVHVYGLGAWKFR
jgi:hypothetical protein